MILKIRTYFQNENEISRSNSGYIDNSKSVRNARIFPINSHKCRLYNSKKLNILKQAIIKF